MTAPVVGAVVLGGVVLAIASAIVTSKRARLGQWRRRRRPGLTGEIVFAHREGVSALSLDCLVRSGRLPVDGAVLQPVHLRAQAADLFGGAMSVADLVVRWVGDDRPVKLEIMLDGPDRGRLRASTDGSAVMLELMDRRDIAWRFGLESHRVG